MRILDTCASSVRPRFKRTSLTSEWTAQAQHCARSLGLYRNKDKARLFTVLNLAEADTAIATWDHKRYHDFWRPMQAIAQADIDGNIDTVQNTSWSPLIPTPSFPAFTRGHRAFSNAGATIMASFLGTANISFTTNSESPLPSGSDSYRTFNSFSEVVAEAGISRIYETLHDSFDNIAGQALGADVATNTFSNYRQVMPEPSSCLLTMMVGLMTAIRRRR